MSKKILGLDLGTNSIGWALIDKNDKETGEVIAAGSRIIPMSQDILGKFDNGVSISQTADRTRLRGNRRLRERYLLRRERLHRVLNILGFLPEHYSEQIDFQKHFGQFFPEAEPKIAYVFNIGVGKADFLFKETFNEMLADFAKRQAHLLDEDKKIPYDWTIYYLRKKALNHKISKAELAWLILHFNQKRGYYQREDSDVIDKSIEIRSLKVLEVIKGEKDKKSERFWYEAKLENSWIYKTTSYFPLENWVDNIKEFIVTKELAPDNTTKKDKEGKDKIRLSILPSFEEIDLMAETEKNKIYGKIKIKTETEIEKTGKTVGTYIYDTLLQNPNQKIKGKLVRTIERKFYKDELRQILETQQRLHAELQDKNKYQTCLKELYEHNEAHRNSIGEKDFVHLFLNDILFYQRPLKSKKSLIANCRFERRIFIKDGEKETEPLKCIAKSHPLFQEFRLIKFVQSLRIYQKEKEINGKLETDVDVTTDFLSTIEDRVNLFDWLNGRKEIDQKTFLRYPVFHLKKSITNFRWNYVEDKTYPCNETRATILSRLSKIENIPGDFLTAQNEEDLWHILYSVEDKIDLEKALRTFSTKRHLNEDLSKDFVDQFKKSPPFKKDYGSYSAKAIKKLLPLMRLGKYWSLNNIHLQTKGRIERIITGEYDEKMREQVRKKAFNLTEIDHFQNLPEWLASYIVYDRHSEDESALKWKRPDDIKILEHHSLRNPIVEQVINETLQVVRDIWRHYGNGEEGFFNEIHIELGREMKNTKADREKITKQVSENQNTNLRIKALLMEMLNDLDIENVRPYSPSQHEILKIYEEGVLNSVNENIPEEILKISKQAHPTQSELTRYKLWLQQKYRSPYTGDIIPLNKLFTRAYDIEHIIPQSRYFDDSFSNKVICESIVNGQDYKANQTGYEFIKAFRGKIVDELSTNGKTVTIFTVEAYENFVKENYSNSRGKMKRLLMDDIPESFILRQLNDSRYISKVVKNLMSNIIREEGEQETTSKNVVTSNGAITSVLKQSWGLNDIWNEIITPRFERLNAFTKSSNFGEWINKEGKQVFQTQMPLELQNGFSKKRIDHRHHAMDAIVIACASKDHINYLNNESALGKRSKEDQEKKRYDLRNKLCFKKYNDAAKQNYKWLFHKPWSNFTKDVKDILHEIVISFKQNQRVINKMVNHYQKWTKDNSGVFIKQTIRQTKGDSWAIRKSMHKDTVSGLVKLKLRKAVSLATALDNWEMITDKSLRKQIKELVSQNYDKKNIIKFFKEIENKWDDNNISKVEIFYWDIDKKGEGNNAASRVKVDESFNTSMIKSITDTGIQKIMLEHLKVYNEEKNGTPIERPELAFSPDGLDKLNKNIKELNGGKSHQPIYKVRTYEPKGNKFNVGTTGNKKDKYVEAAKGTNLFFAIYQDENGNRIYNTIPLNIVIERQNISYINFEKLTKNKVNRIYKLVSCTGNEGHFVPHYYSKEILKNEMGTNNKNQNALDGTQIKMYCIKLKINRLGNISPADK
ncbi:MAG TPA: HNH endonuclease domain-containing protein [Puia sp.]|nr:HNH endonuclease domain-containing protein [Puia sp.]